MEPVFQICDTHTVLNRIPFKELEEWVNDPLGDDVQCLEIEKKVYSKPSDDQTNEQRAQSQAKEQREQWQKLAFRHCRVAIEFEELKLFELCRVAIEFEELKSGNRSRNSQA